MKSLPKKQVNVETFAERIKAQKRLFKQVQAIMKTPMPETNQELSSYSKLFDFVKLAQEREKLTELI